MLEELKKTLESWPGKGMVSLREAQQTADRQAVVGGRNSAPSTMGCLHHVWGDRRRKEKRGGGDQKVQETGRSTTQARLVVAAKRMDLPRRWFLNLLKNVDALSVRSEPLRGWNRVWL